MAVNDAPRRLPLVDESQRGYEHPLYRTLLATPGLSLLTASLDALLEWGTRNSLWVFPMATSCCGIELMSAAASRVDLDRMGTIVRATPRQADVMVVAGTITVKMAPRVKALWEQMPAPKWCIAMGSCAISGDFYRELYSVVPGIDTVLPVDVYIPGCPPNPEALMHGLLRLQEKLKLAREGKFVSRELNPSAMAVTQPSVARRCDPSRDPALTAAQDTAARNASSLDRDDESSAYTREGPPEETPATAPREDRTPEDLEALFREEFGVEDFPKDAPPVVATARHLALARRLKSLGYKLFVYAAASHHPAKGDAPERFEVAYALRSVGKGSRVASWRLRLNTDEPAPSLVGVFAGADWQEREQFDLVGVRFDGHPDLRRIMLPEGWEGHPLRKEYPSDASAPPWR